MSSILVTVVLLTSKGCDSTSNAMPSAWFSFDIFVTLVHILFLHDLYPLVYALDTAPMLSSTSLLDRNLVIVISLDCARQKYSLTMRLDSGCAPDFA